MDLSLKVKRKEVAVAQMSSKKDLQVEGSNTLINEFVDSQTEFGETSSLSDIPVKLKSLSEVCKVQCQYD